MTDEAMRSIISQIRGALSESKTPLRDIEAIRDVLAGYSPKKNNPVDHVRWVPYTEVEANDYNPNAVAKREMKLLHTSITHDGYTQPIVTIYDKERGKYVIVDGFHRYATMVYNRDLQEANEGMVPIVVIDKSINDRMASTIRHNRARGKHSVEGMSNVVLNMLKNGWSDEDVCNELGLEPEEMVRLKYTSGFAKLYRDKQYSQSWETTNQIRIRNEYMSKSGEKTEDIQSGTKENAEVSGNA